MTKRSDGPRVYQADLATTVPDDHNANRGTDRGATMLSRSVEELGAGRAIVVDKAGRVVAGNKSRAAMLKAGLSRAIVVETDGTRPIVVKRTDFDLSKPRDKARRYATFDNRTSEVGLTWDPDEISAAVADGLELDGLWTGEETDKLFGKAEQAGLRLVETDSIEAEFWLVVRGPLRVEPEVIRELARVLGKIPGVEVEAKIGEAS